MKDSTKNEILKSIHRMLKDREIHPTGTFDKQGRFYAENSDLINVRTPSKSYPFSEMTACRTLKYVKAVSEKFNACSKSAILKHI